MVEPIAALITARPIEILGGTWGVGVFIRAEFDLENIAKKFRGRNSEIESKGDGRKFEVGRCLDWSCFNPAPEQATQEGAATSTGAALSLCSVPALALGDTKNQGAPGMSRHPGLMDPLALGVRGSIQQRATAKAIPPSGTAAD